MPFILQNKWANGWTILALPRDNCRITKYEDFKKIVRGYRKKSRNIPKIYIAKVLNQGKDFRSLKFHEITSKEIKKFPFTLGWVGFLGYDLGAKFVRIKQKVKDDLICTEVYFAFCDRALVKDPRGQWWFLTLTPNILTPPAILTSITSEVLDLTPEVLDVNSQIHENFMKSNLTKAQYKGKINAIKKYLKDGETYQVNFSQRFKTPFNKNPLSLFQKISKLNPSPYQFYCEDKNFAVISNSPERLIYKKRQILETRPIKGTISRGRNSAEDRRNIEKLLKSEKEKAELEMIIDLERNDLGKVSIPSTVKVVKHRKVEKYSDVIHTISIIHAVMRKNKDVFDVIEAIFPGGSITGCPKKRTMEIIDKLEDFKRGVYCGSAGYISLTGNFEFNIMIRTAFFKNKTLYLHSGGGIVMDSEAKKEYSETIDKANAFIKALKR